MPQQATVGAFAMVHAAHFHSPGVDGGGGIAVSTCSCSEPDRGVAQVPQLDAVGAFAMVHAAHSHSPFVHVFPTPAASVEFLTLLRSVGSTFLRALPIRVEPAAKSPALRDMTYKKRGRNECKPPQPPPP